MAKPQTWIIDEATWIAKPEHALAPWKSVADVAILFYPTATLWSVGCVPKISAAQRLRFLKQRDTQKPFLLIWHDSAELLRHLEMPDTKTQKFLQKYLGQSVTFVCPREWFRQSDWIPEACISQDNKVAVRVDPLRSLCQLIKASGYPAWLSTSVNLPGEVPEGNVTENSPLFQAAFPPKVLFVSSQPTAGQASTLVDVVAQKVLRPGPVALSFGD